MSCTTRIGSVLTRTGTHAPAGLHLETKDYLPGWKMVTDSDGFALDATLRKTGWSFFFLAATLHTTVWGSWNEATLLKALKRVVKQLKRSHFNSLEITAIAGKHFLGLPYLQLSANSRQMQEGMSLGGKEIKDDIRAGISPYFRRLDGGESFVIGADSRNAEGIPASASRNLG